MIPLRLEMSGFTCFRERTVVNLEELEQDLFAIAGPTGAGKSTLLDAITFALYGQTARLGSRGVLDALVSPGLDQLQVQLAFHTDRGCHRVTRVVVRRTSGPAQEVRIEQLQPDASWRQLPESEKIREANAKLEELVGLDYEGFTRAVLLPQGAFDEFLRGDAGKRRKLLTSLLGLDRVERMAKEAGREARDAKTRSEALKTRLDEDYAGATPERKRALADELAALDREVGELGADIAEREALLRELDEVRALATEKAELEGALRELTAAAGELAGARERLERGRRAALLAPQLRALRAQRDRLRELERRRAATDAERRDAEAELATASAAVAEAETARAAGTRGVPEQLEALAAVVPRAALLRRRGGSLALADGADDAPYDEQHWEALQRAQGQLPTWKRLRGDGERAARLQRQAQATAAELRREAEALETTLKELLRDGSEARSAHEAALAALRAAVTEDRAAALRLHLHRGDPCPVCGSTVSELPAGGEVDVAALERAAAKAEERRTLLKERYLEARERLQGLRGRADDKEAEAQRAQAQRAELQREAAALAEQLAALLGEAADAGAAEGVEPAAVEGALAATGRRLLARLAAEIRAVTGGEDPEALRAELRRRQGELEAAVKRAEAARASAERRRDAAATTGALLGEQHEAAAADAATAERDFAAALAASGFASAEAVAEAELSEAEITRLEARLTQHAARRDATERRLAELEVRLQGRVFDADDHRERVARLAEARHALQAAATRRGNLQAQLQRVEGQLARAKELRAELAAAEARFDTHRQLQLELRGDRFQDFLMTRVQQQLAARASHIVRTVTDGRYDLRLQDGEYHVRDAWNTGELRSARTLSGGETFIASLALALALSDTVAGSRALGALFLDEGFGTLDGETLDAVATVLENLTREGRMVGIITHVAGLAERLPARLLVDKGPQGSAVRWDA